MISATTNTCCTPFKEVDGVTVLHVDLRPDAGREAEAAAWLSDEERLRCSRFLYAGPRRRFALCRATLRALLRDRLGCDNARLTIGAFEFGKPFAALRGEIAPVSFNVSHSGAHGLIAIAPDGRLGVDVEERVARKGLDGLMQAALTPDERAELAASDDGVKLRGFLRLWTIKEAVIKAVGLGISMSMSELEVPPAMRRGESGGVFSLRQTPGTAWRLEDLGTDDFAAAVAHEVASA